MEYRRHTDCSRKGFLEDFMLLRDSDFWTYLKPKTKQGILNLLDQYRETDIQGKPLG